MLLNPGSPTTFSEAMGNPDAVVVLIVIILILSFILAMTKQKSFKYHPRM